jgi:energy-coupling factor transporter ATP-binding protein EcfA2
MAEEVIAIDGVITRIAKLSLLNFRGFKGHQTIQLDTDADLVLLTGPNGYGKSSLLEAILLLLTGWYGERHPVKDFISRRRAGGEDEHAEPHERCELHASVVTANPSTEDEQRLDLVWTRDHEGHLPLPTRLPVSQLLTDPEDPDERELDARLCGFFQDRVERLFDEAASGRTLRDVFEPVPAVLRDVHEVLSEVDDALRKEATGYEQRWNGSPPDMLHQTLNDAYRRLRPLYLALAERVSRWPQGDETPSNIADDSALDDFARRVVQDSRSRYDTLRRAFKHIVTREMPTQLNTAKRQASGTTRETAELERQIEEIERRIENIKERYPTLERDLTVFSPDDSTLPDALSIFRALAAYAQRWSQARVWGDGPDKIPHLQKVLDELAAVWEDDAGKRAQEIEAWLLPRQQAAQELETLNTRLDDLKQQRQQSRSAGEVRELEQLQRNLNAALDHLDHAWREAHTHTIWQANRANHQAAKTYLENACKAVNWYKGEFEVIIGPSPELQKALQERVETILERFSLVDGFLPLQLVANDQNGALANGGPRRYHIRTADGRELVHLSTGQRAQVAVSLLTGQNLAIPHKLNHRIVLLDDVTTAYDLSNLTREAILWRQLAYGNEDEQQCRQIFISSHHEDMTNHLLDLLVPPAGKRMRMIRFTGWNPETGPELAFFEVTPTGAAKPDNPYRAELAKSLESF